MLNVLAQGARVACRAGSRAPSIISFISLSPLYPFSTLCMRPFALAFGSGFEVVGFLEVVSMGIVFQMNSMAA